MPLYQIIFLIIAFLLGIGILIFVITFINKVATEEEAAATREKPGP
ncbi:MAG: hypothetical protein K8I27_06350 [Planctomycetes bacterium]|nr:hypothetical protein [Planctomycetota bacterium]